MKDLRTIARAHERPQARRALEVAGLTLVVAVLGASCGGGRARGDSGGPPPGAVGDATCTDLAFRARDEMDAAARANRACSQDSDCVVVGFSSSCFDGCTNVVTATGKAAFEDARRRADEGPCAGYAQRGCPPLIAKPCAPPAPPACRGGQCLN